MQKSHFNQPAVTSIFFNRMTWTRDFTVDNKTGIPKVWYSLHNKSDKYFILLLKVKRVLNGIENVMNNVATVTLFYL